MRNIQKNVENGKAVIAKHPKADIDLGEIGSMCDMLMANADEEGSVSLDAIHTLITDAFYFGVAVGNRNA